MKLVDILARELKVWPDKYVYISHSQEVGFFASMSGGGCMPLRISDHNFVGQKRQTVFRAEWQAAVDALKAEQAAQLKWPDGATHFTPKDSRMANDVFYKVENGKAVIGWPYYKGEIHYPSTGMKEDYVWETKDTIPRPTERAAEWAGFGLPPVGTVCEVLWNESSMEYLITKVFGVNEHGQPIHRFDEGPKKYQYQADVLRTVSGTQVFRPIRTAEQVAAEEREKAAIKLFYAVMDHPASSWDRLQNDRKDHYLSLVDAGWKQVTK